MKTVCFVGYRWAKAGSNHMRGMQIAEELLRQEHKTYCVPKNICDIGDGIYVFIKHLEDQEIEFVKERKGKIIWDMIDIFCHREKEKQRTLDNIKEIDGVILPNEEVLKKLEIKKPSRVIHHHWDKRHQRNFDLFRKFMGYSFRLGYVGFKASVMFVDDFSKEITTLTDFGPMMTFSPIFTCHYNVRNERDQIYKPCTKISVAAAVESNIITTRDEALKGLLPDDYPYYTEATVEEVKKTIDFARDSFGTPTWKYGLQAMAEVKERTKIENIAKEYIGLFEEIC